jgi:hypothetical protein
MVPRAHLLDDFAVAFMHTDPMVSRVSQEYQLIKFGLDCESLKAFCMAYDNQYQE